MCSVLVNSERVMKMRDEDIEYQKEQQEMMEDEGDIDVYPETTMQFNKWLVDINPRLKRDFEQLSKELVVSNLTSDEVNRGDSKLDICYQCAMSEFQKASNFFLFKTSTMLSLNRSKGGFQVKQLGTIRQEKDITRTESKRKKNKVFGRFGR